MGRSFGWGISLLVLTLSCAAPAQDHGGHEQSGGHGHGGVDRHRHAPPPGVKSRVGEQISDFALSDSNGKAFRLASIREAGQNKGTIAVLTIWCTTCHSCRVVERDFDRKAKEYKEKGVLFLMVDSNASETAEQVNRFLEKNELSFPVLMDPESQIARYLGATVTTTTAVVDAKGTVRYYGSFERSENALADLLDGKDVAVKETPPHG